MKIEELMELLDKANVITGCNGPCKFLNVPQIEKASWGNGYSVSCGTMTKRDMDKITEIKIITVSRGGQKLDVGIGQTWAHALMDSVDLMTVIKERAK